MAEQHVQTAKKMYKTFFLQEKDIDMALHHYITPLFESPVVLLMSRKLRSN